MSTFKKHIGRIKNTDRRCVVVMMQVPGREDHALIIDTDALPDRFHDALMQVVDSHEGQSVLQLHTLLSRRVLPDNGVDMMNALHVGGYLRAVPIDNVVMYPAPHSPCPLRSIIEHMGVEVPMSDEVREELANQHIENQKVDENDKRLGIAKSLLQQASDLEYSANKKREEAYQMFPGLRPAAAVTEMPVEAPVVEEAMATIQEPPVVEPTLEEATAPVVAMEEVDEQDDLPPEVAEAYAAALEQAKATESAVLNEDAAHAVDTSADAVEDFLDRAAAREDKANKVAKKAAEPKKPVGRPRKDGTPAGSARE